MELGDLKVRVSADIANFSRSMNSVGSSLGGLKGKFGAFAKVGVGAAVAIGASLATLAGGVIKAGVSYDMMREQSTVAWTTLLGSGQKAEAMMNRIGNLAKSTPFETADVDMMAKYLFNAGINGDKLSTSIMRISDVASAFNIPIDNAKEMTRQMSQVIQANGAYTEDLNILQDQGVPIYKALAKEMNTNVAGVRKLASEGKVSATDYINAFNSIAASVKGASADQSKTMGGMLSTLKDNFNMLAGVLSKPIFDVLKAGLVQVNNLLTALLAAVQGNLTPLRDLLTNVFGAQGAQAILNFVTGLGTALTNIGTMFSQGEANLSGFGAAFSSIFNSIKSIVVPILTDVVAFIGQQLQQVAAFWKAHGAVITQAVQNLCNFIAAIIKFLAPIVLFIIQDLWNAVKNIISGAIKIIEGIILVFSALFTGNWKALWDGIKLILSGALQAAWGLFNLLIGKILKGAKLLGDGALNIFKSMGSGIKSLFSALGSGVVGIVNSMKSSVVSHFSSLWSGAKAVFNSMRAGGASIFSALGAAIKSTIGSMVSSVVGKFKSLWDGAKSAANGLKSSVVGAFNSVKSTAASIFGGIKSAIVNPIQAAKNTIGGIINGIKGMFSGMHISIPSIKLPHVSFSTGHKKIGPISIPYPIPSVSWYKKGGIFNGASVIGVGEAGSEAVVPLQGNRMKPFADAIAGQMKDTGNGTVTNHFNIAQLIVREEADVKRVAQKLKDMQDRSKRKGGK